MRMICRSEKPVLLFGEFRDVILPDCLIETNTGPSANLRPVPAARISSASFLRFIFGKPWGCLESSSCLQGSSTGILGGSPARPQCGIGSNAGFVPVFHRLVYHLSRATQRTAWPEYSQTSPLSGWRCITAGNKALFSSAERRHLRQMTDGLTCEKLLKHEGAEVIRFVHMKGAPQVVALQNPVLDFSR